MTKWLWFSYFFSRKQNLTLYAKISQSVVSKQKCILKKKCIDYIFSIQSIHFWMDTAWLFSWHRVCFGSSDSVMKRLWCIRINYLKWTLENASWKHTIFILSIGTDRHTETSKLVTYVLFHLEACRPQWLSRMHVQLVIRRLHVRFLLFLATFFCEDFLHYSLPSTNSARAVSFWGMTVHCTG